MFDLFKNNTMRSIIEIKATLFLRQNFTYAPQFNAREVLLLFSG